jgi:hypothetical protein
LYKQLFCGEFFFVIDQHLRVTTDLTTTVSNADMLISLYTTQTQRNPLSFGTDIKNMYSQVYQFLFVFIEYDLDLV